MQHPVGFEIDPETGRAVLNDIGAVLFQNTAWIAFLHTLSASFLVSGAGVAGVSAWMIMKNRQADVFRPAAKLGAWVILVSAVLVSVTGDMDMKIMVEQQPMKVAAAEALYETQENAPFSILSVGDLSGDSATTVIEIPGLLSYLATGTWNGPESTVQGINNLQAQYLEEFPQYGPEMNFVAVRPGHLLGLPPDDRPRHDRRPVRAVGAVGLPRRPHAEGQVRHLRQRDHRALPAVRASPPAGSSPRWAASPGSSSASRSRLTAVSPLLTTTEVWISMIGFTLVYAILAIIEVALLLKYIKKGAPEVVVEDPYEDAKNDDNKQLYFAY